MNKLSEADILKTVNRKIGKLESQNVHCLKMTRIVQECLESGIGDEGK